MPAEPPFKVRLPKMLRTQFEACCNVLEVERDIAIVEAVTFWIAQRMPKAEASLEWDHPESVRQEISDARQLQDWIQLPQSQPCE